MIETFASIAFVIAIILMCGPKACYNAGSWIGLILMVFWKVAVWTYRTISKAVTQKKEPPQVASLSAPKAIYAKDLTTHESAKEEPFEGHIIEGKATVL